MMGAAGVKVVVRYRRVEIRILGITVCNTEVSGPVLTLVHCWYTLCQQHSGEVLARANSRLPEVLAHSVLTAGSVGVRTLLATS